MQQETAIPHFYLTLCEGNKQSFKACVRAYIQSSHPGYQLKKINGMKAMIERVDD